MDYRELRVNNWVTSKEFSFAQVVIISQYGIDMRKTIHHEQERTYTLKPEQLEGISLNTERLLKFGFQSTEAGEAYVKDRLLLRWGYANTITAYLITAGSEIELRKVRYVHEIQNLFFILIGEELEAVLNRGHSYGTPFS
jgi:hypothetical protein